MLRWGCTSFFGCYYPFELMKEVGACGSLRLKECSHTFINKQRSHREIRFSFTGAPFNGLKLFYHFSAIVVRLQSTNAIALSTSDSSRR